jgi:ATP-dependent DNA ligase
MNKQTNADIFDNKIIIFRVLCKSKSHLNEMVLTITENGGEGVIIRKLHSCYENGRSTHLLKIKVSIFFFTLLFFIITIFRFLQLMIKKE